MDKIFKVQIVPCIVSFIGKVLVKYEGDELDLSSATYEMGFVFSGVNGLKPDSLAVSSEEPKQAPVSVSNQPIVSDVFSEKYSAVNCSTPLEFHIPAINIAGAEVASLNEEIYTMLYDYIQNEKKYLQLNNGYATDKGSVWYSWTDNGDVLSLGICLEHQEDFGGDRYLLYNVSKSSGKRLSNQDLIRMSGLTEEDYNRSLFRAVEHKWHDRWKADGVELDRWDLETLEQTLSEENLMKVQLFLDNAGNLSAVAPLHIPIESGVYEYIIDLSPFILSSDTSAAGADNMQAYSISNKPGPQDLVGQLGVTSPTSGWLSNYETKYIRGTTTGNAYLRWSPSKKGEEYNRYVREGEKVTVLAVEGSYSLVKSDDGRYGWVTLRLLSD